MRKIYAMGEALLDIIFRNGTPVAAKPGGAMLNSIVSLGRTGMPATFISEYADDETGCIIDNFLRENSVDTGNIYRYKDGKTALALAFLDADNNAGYTFYKKYPPVRLNMDMPVIGDRDLFLFGSVYAYTSEVREKLRTILQTAVSNDAIIIYDPNFRAAHLPELSVAKPLIIHNISTATLVRGSDEDFFNIFGASSADEAWDIISELCPCLVYTASSKGVSVRTRSFSADYPVRKIEPVSTIGAGDNFNAGLIRAVCDMNLDAEQVRSMGAVSWKKVVECGIDFATDVCMGYDNYISHGLASRYRQGL